MAQQSAFAGTGIYKTPLLQTDSKGKTTNVVNWQWMKQFEQAVAQFAAPVSTQFPASSTAAGVVGKIATDGNWLYVCIGANLWKRVALSSF